MGISPLPIGVIPAESAPAGLIASAIGLITAAGELFGGVIAPSVAGWLADWFGLAVPFYLCVGLALICEAVALLLRESHGANWKYRRYLVHIEEMGEAPQPQAFKAPLLRYFDATGETRGVDPELSALLEHCSPSYRRTSLEPPMLADPIMSSQPHLPNRSNRNQRSGFSQWLYRQRNLVESFFNRIKQFRGIGTRYDKDPANYLAALPPSESPPHRADLVPSQPLRP